MTTIYYDLNCTNNNISVEFEHFATNLGGFSLEFSLPSVNPEYRVFITRDSRHYFILHNGKQIAELTCGGHILKYKDSNLELDEKLLFSFAYNNYEKGYLELKGNRNHLIFLNDENVGEISFGGEGIISWLIRCIKDQKLLSYESWKGVRYNETKIDTDIALTLLFSRIASFD